MLLEMPLGNEVMHEVRSYGSNQQNRTEEPFPS